MAVFFAEGTPGSLPSSSGSTSTAPSASAGDAGVGPADTSASSAASDVGAGVGAWQAASAAAGADPFVDAIPAAIFGGADPGVVTGSAGSVVQVAGLDPGFFAYGTPGWTYVSSNEAYGSDPGAGADSAFVQFAETSKTWPWPWSSPAADSGSSDSASYDFLLII